ncbi:MAG: alpha/beta fold hydrolase [Desulfobacteraceae bacterium]|nr:alpha/beta fold hydrolase [Desulfobacteraceae bacterium]
MPKVHVNDIEMYYEIRGQGVPLVLIHGLGSSARDWEAQVPEFAQAYRVVTVDLRGHGRSDAPQGPYSIDMFASDLAALLQVLSLMPAHVIGLSMGSAVAWHLALDYPQVVHTLVLTNMSAEVPVKTWSARWTFYSRVLMVHVLGMHQVGKLLAPKLFPRPEQADQRRKMIQRWAQNDKNAYLRALYTLKNWSVMDRLGEVQCPVLVVASDQDYSSLTHKKEYTLRMPRAELVVIEDARHALPLEKPAAFNAAVMKFLASNATT